MESKLNITFDGNKKVSAHFREFTVHTDQPERARRREYRAVAF